MASDTGIDYLKSIIKRWCHPEGLFMEFGVSSGSTIKRLAKFVPDIIYGFDSFEGLPEEWTGHGGMPKGSFRCDPPKELPANVVIVKGLFQDTLPGFLERHPGPVSFAHIDCDLYSATKFVLGALVHRLDGAVLAFDEITGPECYELHEGKAFREFLSEAGYTAEFLGAQHDCGQVYRLSKND